MNEATTYHIRNLHPWVFNGGGHIPANVFARSKKNWLVGACYIWCFGSCFIYCVYWLMALQTMGRCSFISWSIREIDILHLDKSTAKRILLTPRFIDFGNPYFNKAYR
jgi:hypothetical protein